jgi:hypothetical protein
MNHTQTATPNTSSALATTLDKREAKVNKLSNAPFYVTDSYGMHLISEHTIYKEAWEATYGTTNVLVYSPEEAAKIDIPVETITTTGAKI